MEPWVGLRHRSDVDRDEHTSLAGPSSCGSRVSRAPGSTVELASLLGNRAFSRLARMEREERASGAAFRCSRQHLGGLLQRLPVAAFAALDPWPVGTAIPLEEDGTWKRPVWLRGQENGARTVRMQVLALKVPAMTAGHQDFWRCFRCAKLGDANGMAVDHVVDWKASCAGATDRQGLEARYHEVNNLEPVHTNCNSSKSDKDLFDWWVGAWAEPYVAHDETLRTLRWGVAEVYKQWGVDWLYEVPEAARKPLVQNIVAAAVKLPSANVLAHLMAAAKLKDTMPGGWK